MGYLGTLVVLALIGLGGAYYYQTHIAKPVGELVVPGDPILHIGDTTLKVLIADTPAARAQGLSGRDSLGSYGGLLFIFDKPDYHGFWMKDMQFNIDIIWVSSDLKVLGVTKDLSPGTYPQVFEPPQPAQYVIETKPHFASDIGIKVGDRVELPLGYQKQ